MPDASIAAAARTTKVSSRPAFHAPAHKAKACGDAKKEQAARREQQKRKT